jgi:tetratricopeptide (TPR) repeat protein
LIIIKRYKIFSIVITISILFLISFSASAAVKEPNWQALKEKSNNTLQNEPNEIMANYDLTISLVNLGDIKAAYNNINKIGSDFEEQKFVKKVSPYLYEICKYQENILLLNYAAFYGVIVEDYNFSIKYFNKILQLTPENYNIRNFLSASHLELEEYDLAIKEAKKALETKDNEFSHLLLGAIYYETGNILKALNQLSKSGSLGRKLLNNN